jgi:hypothetical protein
MPKPQPLLPSKKAWFDSRCSGVSWSVVMNKRGTDAASLARF